MSITYLNKENLFFYEKTIFENENFVLKEYCFLHDNYVSMDKETKLFKIKLPEGYGFINKDMEIVVPAKYENVRMFNDGFVLVSKLDKNNKEKWLFVNKEGKEFIFEKEYPIICDNENGLFRVSALKIDFSLCDDYFSDFDATAGVWGYVDTSGKEVIKPQYIYATDFYFEGGLALVCKGEWNRNKHGNYYTEVEKWGLINKKGKEVIPCIFDEIKIFIENDNYSKDYYGALENGKYGIINNCGEWVVPPKFLDLDYCITCDGVISFCEFDEKSGSELWGLFCIPERRVIIEPKYSDIEFLENNLFEVEEYGKKAIIDKYGKIISKINKTSVDIPLSENSIFHKTYKDQKYGLVYKNDIIFNNLYNEIQIHDDLIITEDEYGSNFIKIEYK